MIVPYEILYEIYAFADMSTRININRAFNDNNTNNMNNAKFSSLYDIAKNSYNKTAAIK